MRRLVALGAVCLALTTTRASADDPLAVGFIGSLSGIGAPVGRDALDGFRLALEGTADRLGGVEVQLVIADDRSSEALAAQHAESMRAGGTTLFIVASARPAANAAVAAVTTAGKAFAIGVSNAPPALAGKSCSPFFFSLAPTAEAEHAVMARYLATLGEGRIWLASAQTESARAAAEAFKAAYSGTIVGESVGHPGQMSFPEALVAIDKASDGLDGIYSVVSSGMGVNFIRQFGARGLNTRLMLFAPSSFLDQPYTAAIGNAAIDAITAAPWVEDLDNPVSLRFAAEFEAHFGRPPSVSAAFGYDAALLLDSAFRSASADKDAGNKTEALRTALRRAEFQSVRGKFRFQTNHFPLHSWYLAQLVHTARGRVGNEMRQVLAKDVRDPQAAECPMRWQDPLAPPVAGRAPRTAPRR